MKYHIELPSISEVLEYKCDVAMAVFKRKYQVDDIDAEDLWRDTLQWLWLGRFHEIDCNMEKPRQLVIFPQLLSIDEMWHAFILCTREYHYFCNHFFGCYIHHAPNKESDQILSIDEFKSNIEYVSNVLGRKIAMRWYVSLPITFENTIELSQLTPLSRT